MAIKVTLRKKKIKGNKQSLYFDFYPPIKHPKTGMATRREFLGLYVFEAPKSVLDKQHNTETLIRAKQLLNKKENSLNKPEIYNEFEAKQIEIKEQSQKDSTIILFPFSKLFNLIFDNIKLAYF